MTTENTLLARCGSKCELCAADAPIAKFEVAPSDGSVEQSVMLCPTCTDQINDPDTLDGNHWRCLNDSMWSQVLPVQVMAWRQLKTLKAKGEDWAQDLVDMMYFEEDVQKWAEAGMVDFSAETTRDSNGAPLIAGDNVTLIKDLVVKGANFTAKRGTMVRGISLTENPLHVEGKVNGTRIVLISAYLKKQ
ncbi:MAG: PhnA domain-containing protein [Oleispira sp.]